MKSYIFSEDDFNAVEFAKTVKGPSDVKVKHKDGTHTNMHFSLSGVSMTVEQLIDMCDKAKNREFAEAKLKTIKGLKLAVEITLPKDQVIKLEPAESANTESASVESINDEDDTDTELE